MTSIESVARLLAECTVTRDKAMESVDQARKELQYADEATQETKDALRWYDAYVPSLHITSRHMFINVLHMNAAGYPPPPYNTDKLYADGKLSADLFKMRVISAKAWLTKTGATVEEATRRMQFIEAMDHVQRAVIAKSDNPRWRATVVERMNANADVLKLCDARIMEYTEKLAALAMDSKTQSRVASPPFVGMPPPAPSIK